MKRKIKKISFFKKEHEPPGAMCRRVLIHDQEAEGYEFGICLYEQCINLYSPGCHGNTMSLHDDADLVCPVCV